ncbi:hypothetical protein TWF481_003504 [Arthrobotrys musiformis]|uniref:DASH complex subunit DAD3 n=1 Tax=Arthrobotrys musiformis TaxID=47236 RepID=A0AAV9VQP7_9PEZI
MSVLTTEPLAGTCDVACRGPEQLFDGAQQLSRWSKAKKLRRNLASSSSRANTNKPVFESTSHIDAQAIMRLNQLSHLEREILDEYRSLLQNLNQLSTTIGTLADQPTSQTIDSLRLLERKTGLVSTLMKASVYSIILQQELHYEGSRDVNHTDSPPPSSRQD